MTWSLIGSDTYRNVTTGQTAWTLPAGVVGDMRVILFLSISSTVGVSGLSGGGVTTWSQVTGPNAISSSSIGVAAISQIWVGPVTSTGTALTLTYTGTLGAMSCRAMSRTFRSSRGLITAPQLAGATFSQTSNVTTPSPLTWPTVPALRPGELVVGCMGNDGLGTGYAGSTAGFTYTTDSDGNWHQYRLNTGSVESEAPQMTYTSNDGWYATQVVLDDGLYDNVLTQTTQQAVSRASIW